MISFISAIAKINFKENKQKQPIIALTCGLILHQLNAKKGGNKGRKVTCI